MTGQKDLHQPGHFARPGELKFPGIRLRGFVAAQLGDALELNSPVDKIHRTGQGWTVVTPNGRAEHDVVIYCGTAHRLAELVVADLRILLGVPAKPEFIHCAFYPRAIRNIMSATANTASC